MEGSKLYKYERYYFRMFTPLMLLITVIFAVYEEYVGGGITLLLGILLVFSYQGILVDAEEKKYLKYDRFLSFKLGNWQDLSTPCYVTIVRIKLSSRRTAASPMVTPEEGQRAKAYKVNLVVEGDERFVGICRGTRENMIQEALRLGSYLGIRVLDFTTHEKKWIL